MATNVFAAQASAYASRPTEHLADAILDAACKEAVGLIRAGRPGRAHFRLARVALRAEAVLNAAERGA